MVNKYKIFSLSLLLSMPSIYGAATIINQGQEELAILASFEDIFNLPMSLPQMEQKLAQAIVDISGLTTIPQIDRDMAIAKLDSKCTQIKKNLEKSKGKLELETIALESFIMSFNPKGLTPEQRQKLFEEFQSGIMALSSISMEKRIKSVKILSDKLALIDKEENALRIKAEIDQKREMEAKAKAEVEAASPVEILRNKLNEGTTTKAEKEALVKEVAEIFGADSKLVESVNKRTDFCPLFLAIVDNNLLLVNLLINVGIDLNKPMTAEGNSPLQSAVKFERIDILRELLKPAILRADKLNVNATDVNGITPLMLACESNNKDAVELLINAGAKLDLQDRVLYKTLERGQSLQMKKVVQSGNLAPVKRAAEHDINVLYHVFPDLDFYNHSGETALMKAIKSENEEIVKLLIDSGASSTIEAVRFKAGRAEKFIATELVVTKSIELAKAYATALIEREKKSLSKRLHKAFVDRDYTTINSILVPGPERGAGQIDAHYTDEQGRNLLMILFDSSQKYFFQDAIAFAEILINMGVPVNTPDNLGRTALHYACINYRNLSTTIIRSLCGKGACVRLADNKGNTALHHAVQACAGLHGAVDFSVALIRYLINERHADINAVNKNLETPLMVAAQLERSETIIRLLLELRANADAQNIHHLTAADLARVLGLVDNARILAKPVIGESKRT